MRKRLILGVPVVVALLLGAIGDARADTVTLTKVASYARSGPFGLAFDGTTSGTRREPAEAFSTR